MTNMITAVTMNAFYDPRIMYSVCSHVRPSVFSKSTLEAITFANDDIMV